MTPDVALTKKLADGEVRPEILLACILYGRAESHLGALDLACELLDKAVRDGDEESARAYADARVYMYRTGWDRRRD